MRGESTLPDATAQFLALVQAAVGDVLVTDGMGLTDTDIEEYVSVGYGESDDEAFAEGNATVEGAGGIQDREQYDIHCAVTVQNTDPLDNGTSGDPAAARARAMGLLAAVRAGLIADSTLRGAVMNASITTWSYRGTKAPGGARAIVRFDINCDAYTKG